MGNNSLTSIDPRTGKIVRFHLWPHPDKVGETLWDFVDNYNLNSIIERKPVTLPSLVQSLTLFDRFVAFGDSWSFINPRTQKALSIPSHQGWRVVLQSMKGGCIELLLDRNFSFVSLRKFNQDHVENLHSRIRSFNGNNQHPMVSEYVNAIRCLACAASTTELLDRDINKGQNCLPDGELGIQSASGSSPSLAEESEVQQYERMLAIPALEENMLRDFSRWRGDRRPG
ncbi:hypothetical protein CAPTEDRAFT_218121 [Capitella teleta]|uniref:Uncharacterized protein n=1 Tax=Capitella teleta TaxID=283909 RepID=R7UFL3_CAPTE|nr:hypothetical protein CAPTEDRAFT_218121 [Capitella teleta]|eukprot:ELU02062.1 hypothetical protein CAPTEDRAFT_218121 [Capitella teleta]